MSEAGAGAGAGAGVDSESKVDQNLYSRQLGVYGLETMGKLIKLDVLVVGMKGIGAEVAKNLILAGPRSVTLFDPEPATPADQGANFYIYNEDIGRPRAEAVVERLSELNSYVSVQVLAEASLSEAVLDRFHVVVFTNTPRTELIGYNEYCHAHDPPIAFLAADTMGPAAWAFSDFGPRHAVLDKDGEPSSSAIITTIDKDGTVMTHDGKRIPFGSGDHVQFNEIEGMTKLNGCKYVVKSVNHRSHSFQVEGDFAEFGQEYTGGGVVETVKVPEVRKFATMRTRVVEPNPEGEMMMLTADFGKFGRPEQLHITAQALSAFYDKHGSYPELHNAEHAAEVVTLAAAFNEQQKAAKESGTAPNALVVEEVDADVVRTVAMLARAELQPLAAVFGGIIAQEVVKQTGKFSPLDGWLYLDAFEVLPKDPLPSAEVALGEDAHTRYAHAIAMFGRTFLNHLKSLKVFLVGAGALGCEFLKAFALMGVGCGKDGLVTVTDMDTIEVSNLNRQFLFRPKDVGAPKSGTAVAAAQAMNPDLNATSTEVPVGPDTESTFTDEFWEGLDLITNALDNLKARLYVDGRAVFYHKPLLESGTLGTKTNTQVIMPHKTESYGDSVDPPEQSIPMCTLRHFPNQIEHCIEWARDMFEGGFTSSPVDAVAFIKDPEAFIEAVNSEPSLSVRRGKLEGVQRAITAARSATFEQCVVIARKLFHEHFYIKISQLLHNFPADYRDPKTGVKFWSGPKRAPHALEFDVENDGHFAFVSAAAHLAAATFGVTPPADSETRAVLGPMLTRVSVTPFVPRSVKIKAEEKDDTTEGGEDDGEVVANITKDLMSLDRAELGHLTVSPQEFEKDDDTNFHIAFIAGAANLRARNYSIQEASAHKVKMIAGKIIPAIATTTALATGLVSLELFKVVANCDVEALRNSFANLAINMYSMSEPMPPKKTVSKDFDVMIGGPMRAHPEGFTSWDKEVVRIGDVTVEEFVEHIQEKHSLEVSMMSSGEKMLYAPMLYRTHAERGAKPMSVVYSEVMGVELERDYFMVDLSVEDDEGDVVMPIVQFYWR